MAFLDKGVGVESSEKLMKELADPSSRLGIPRPKKQPSYTYVRNVHLTSCSTSAQKAMDYTVSLQEEAEQVA